LNVFQVSNPKAKQLKQDGLATVDLKLLSGVFENSTSIELSFWFCRSSLKTAQEIHDDLFIIRDE